VEVFYALYINFHSFINSFTAPACKISGLKDAGTRLQTGYFLVLNTSTFSAIRFDENPFKCQYEKETKNLKDFIFRTFIGRFQVKT